MAEQKIAYPISYEAERALLTAMLTRHDALLAGLSEVHSEDFTHPDHKTVFRIAGELFHNGETVDMVSNSFAIALAFSMG